MLSHYATQRTDSSLKYQRGVKLANHITRILEFCGAKVDCNEKAMSGTGSENKNKEFIMVNHEECEPKAACPVSSEPQATQNPQYSQMTRGTPVDPAYYCAVNEESGEGPVRSMCDVMREKIARTEEGLIASSERQVDCRNEATGVSSENTYVTCASGNEDMATETPYSCVSEKLEWSEKESTERQSDEVKKEEHSTVSTQDASHDQQERALSEVKEFLITDSMKGVKDDCLVYQYCGAVDAKTGTKWNGSLEEYCR